MKNHPQIIIKPYKKDKKNKKIKKILISIFSVVLFLCIVVYLWLSWVINREIKDLQRLKKENKYLKEEIKKLANSDKAYEEILRTKYGFVKDGEKLIIYSNTYKNKKKL